MKRVLLIAFAILTTACETTPPPIDFGFEDFKPVQAEVTYPSTLPKISPLECWPSEVNCQVVGYTSSTDIDKLDAYKILAESNTALATLNAEVIELVLEQADELVVAGKASEQIWKIREEQLMRERIMRQQDKWYYRLLLLGVITAGALTAN